MIIDWMGNDERKQEKKIRKGNEMRRDISSYISAHFTLRTHQLICEWIE